MNTYQLNAVGYCPDNGDQDFYEIIIQAPRTINVAVINDAVATYLEDPIFQEDLTRQLAADLEAHVTIKGWHQGILVTSTAG